MLHYSVLDFLKSEMVFVEHLLCVLEVEIVLCIFIPWQLDESLKIVVLNAVICLLRVHALQFLELLIKYICHFLAPFLLRCLLCQFLDILFVWRTAKFFLDSPKLLIQKIFALLLVEVGLHLALNLLFQVDHLHLLVEELQQFVGKLRYIIDFQQLLTVFHLRQEVTRNEVDHKPRALDVSDGKCCLKRHRSRLLHNLHRHILDALYQSLELAVAWHW